MDYPCGKFGDCDFSRFGSVVRTDTQTWINAMLPLGNMSNLRFIVCYTKYIYVVNVLVGRV